MAWRPYNPNPWRLSTDDCAPRALSAVLRIPWGDAYDLLYENGKAMGLMQNNKAVLWAILKMNSFHREALPDQCPDCYTVADFAADHPRGRYMDGGSRPMGGGYNTGYGWMPGPYYAGENYAGGYGMDKASLADELEGMASSGMGDPEMAKSLREAARHLRKG